MILPDFFRQPCAPFTPEVLDAAGHHAAQEAPRESCGLVRAGRYVACENVHEAPEVAFEISGDAMLAAYAAGDLEGVIHSHPDGPWFPSKDDAEGQIRTDVPWAILVPGEDTAALACHWGVPRPPLFDANGVHIPRKFCHYVSDCLAIVQDFYAQEFGVELPKVSHGWEWWKNGEALYLDHYTAAGFELIATASERFVSIAKRGDVFLMPWNATTPNHAGVYLGNGLMLDHLPNRLSRVSSIGRYLSRITHWVRYTG